MPKFLTSIPGTQDPLVQGSDLWRQLRMGKATASNFSRILTEAKGEYAAGASKYAREVAIQRMLDEDTEFPIDHLPAISRGKLLEPDAVVLYERVRGRTTDAIGLIISDDETCVCSPDRIGSDRLWGTELKCPLGPTHLEYLENGGPGRSYIWQVVGSMHIAGFEGWDFCSYHPGLREVIVSYDRRNYAAELDKLAAALPRFEKDVQRYCDIIRENGYVEPIGRMKPRSVEEWAKLEASDPNLWAIA